jgi:hypothetical protein
VPEPRGGHSEALRPRAAMTAQAEDTGAWSAVPPTMVATAMGVVRRGTMAIPFPGTNLWLRRFLSTWGREFSGGGARKTVRRQVCQQRVYRVDSEESICYDSRQRTGPTPGIVCCWRWRVAALQRRFCVLPLPCPPPCLFSRSEVLRHTIQPIDGRKKRRALSAVREPAHNVSIPVGLPRC